MNMDFVDKRQSQKYKRQLDVDAAMGLKPSVIFYIKYNNEETEIKMRSNHKIGIVLKVINEKYSINNYILMLNGQYSDMSLPAGVYENMTFDLVQKPG